MKFLLDSVIVIDHLNNIADASEWIMLHHADCCLSPITRAEVLAGVKEKVESRIIKSFLDHFMCLSIVAEDADYAGTLRQEYKWKLPDALQASLAIRHDLKLVTRNTKDFQPRKCSFIQVPYKV